MSKENDLSGNHHPAAEEALADILSMQRAATAMYARPRRSDALCGGFPSLDCHNASIFSC